MSLAVGLLLLRCLQNSVWQAEWGHKCKDTEHIQTGTEAGTHMHACRHTHTRMCTHTCAHTHTHACKHTHKHTACTDTHTHMGTKVTHFSGRNLQGRRGWERSARRLCGGEITLFLLHHHPSWCLAQVFLHCGVDGRGRGRRHALHLTQADNTHCQNEVCVSCITKQNAMFALEEAALTGTTTFYIQQA